MTNWGYENNDDTQAGNNTELNGPKALRDAYEAQKKTIDELSAKLTSFLEREEKSKMATVFESLGVPQAAQVYNGPADPDKAKEWIESMKAVFGSPAQPQQGAAAEATPTLPPSMQAQFERMTQAGSDGAPLGNVEAAHAAVNDATDVQGLINSFKNMNI
jgi:hypothetical protein